METYASILIVQVCAILSTHQVRSFIEVSLCSLDGRVYVQKIYFKLLELSEWYLDP